MFKKDYFVKKPSDKADFDSSLSDYTTWIYDFFANNHGISIVSFIEISNKKYEQLDELFNKYSFLNSVYKTDETTNMLQYFMSEYHKVFDPLYQNKDYYEFIKSLTTQDSATLELKRRYLESFESTGLNLSLEGQARLNEINQRLTELKSKFSENIIKSKKEWSYTLTDDVAVTLKESELALFETVNNKKVLKYDQNIFGDLMVQSESTPFKKIIYEAMKYPASSKSNFDNTSIIQEILSLRQESAKLLGYNYYSEHALKNRMANSYEKVTSFLDKIKDKVKPLAQKEYSELNDFILSEFGLNTVEKCERPFYSNKKREQDLNYQFNMERPYFPRDKVYSGIFNFIEEMFDFKFVEDKDAFILPYEDTICYRVYEGDKLKAYLIVDMFERELKSSGAWVSGLSSVTTKDVGLISLCCNVNKKDVGMDISEIHTFLHELGHAIHHLSSEVEHPSMAGTAGMARDAVEIPSQMLEQFSYDRDLLKSISSHYETGEQIPDSMLDSIVASKNYGAGSMYSRQLVFALFDINLYHDFKGDIHEYYKELANSILPIEVDGDTNFPNTFGHIFQGGYSAGYYGYMWADVYSIDAYSFIREDLKSNMSKFKKEFLSKGSSIPADELYAAFRGNEVNIDNFFKYYGV